MVVLFAIAWDLVADTRRVKFDSRPQWGEYLTAQNNQENPQRADNRSRSPAPHNRRIKAPRRTQ
jgi:hypothetical protein